MIELLRFALSQFCLFLKRFFQFTFKGEEGIMNNFVSMSKCNGVQPRGVVERTLYSRPKLVGALLAKRETLRLLLAPPRYGKKYVALEYASVVFQFKRTFWFDCKSPLFYRDLDNGALFEPLLKGEEQANLVVLADVPVLDQSRIEGFYKAVTALQDLNIEVIISSVPEFGYSVSKGLETCIINSFDMGVGSEEIKNTTYNSDLPDETDKEFKGTLIAPRVWEIGFRNIHLEENNTADSREIKIVKFLIYILVKCEVDDLTEILSSVDVEAVCEHIQQFQPHIYANMQNRTVSTERESLEDILRVFKDFALLNINYFNVDDEELLYTKIADLLFKIGEGKRAIAFCKLFLKPAQVLQWTKNNFERIVSLGHCAETIVMLSDVSAHDIDDVALKMFLEFMLYRFTCQSKKCFEIAESLINIPYVPLNVRVLTMSYLGLFADKKRSFDAVGKLCSLHESSSREIKQCDDISGFFRSRRIVNIAELTEIIYDDMFKALVYLSTTVEQKSHQRNFSRSERIFLQYLISCYFDYFINCSHATCNKQNAMRRIIAKSGNRETASRMIKHLTSFIYKAAEEDSIRNNLSIYTILACRSAREISNFLAKKYKLVISPRLEQTIDKYSSVLYEDSKHASYLVAKEEIKKSSIVHSREVESGYFERNPDTSHSMGPTLHIKLFGSVSFTLGDSCVETNFQRRKKTLLLVALLTVNKGREMSRDEIISNLWNSEAAKRKSNLNNLYTMVSAINKFFSSVCGQKFIKHTRFGYRFEASCVSSDFEFLTQTCKSLYYGEFSVYEWREIIELIRNEFSAPFLKYIDDNDFVIRTREVLKTSLIDALVSAGDKLLFAGEFKGCAEFAKEALKYDLAREDAYQLLITSQSELDQRSAAIQTYFTCKENLNNLLGLDPSNSIKQVYKKVLDM